MVGPVRTSWDQWQHCLPHNEVSTPWDPQGSFAPPLGDQRGKGGTPGVRVRGAGGGSGEGDTVPEGKLSCIFGKRRDWPGANRNKLLGFHHWITPLPLLAPPFPPPNSGTPHLLAIPISFQGITTRSVPLLARPQKLGNS